MQKLKNVEPFPDTEAERTKLEHEETRFQAWWRMMDATRQLASSDYANAKRAWMAATCCTVQVRPDLTADELPHVVGDVPRDGAPDRIVTAFGVEVALPKPGVPDRNGDVFDLGAWSEQLHSF